jgi:hypothetical protein
MVNGPPFKVKRLNGDALPYMGTFEHKPHTLVAILAGLKMKFRSPSCATLFMAW